MNGVVQQSFNQLKAYCEKEGYKGWDPFDGLTSKMFRSIPFVRNNRFARLAWIQLFKRSPFNFRPLALVPKEYNAKGLALFLTGYCNLYNMQGQEEDLKKIRFLADKIIELQNQNYSGSCWGYYFDWQARAFFQPANMPTVVATSFVADALLNAYDITGDKNYLDTAISSSKFVLKDLKRTYDNQGNFSFSYSPVDHTQVYNASLLGARLLSRVYHYTKEEELKDEARKAVAYVCNMQQPTGAWAYGTLPFHSWIDSFHTGFNLECIHEYGKYTGDSSYDMFVEKGLDYYINTFFTEEGISKYYDNQTYPVDIHSPAQLVVTLVKLNKLELHLALAEKVLQWTITNMQDEKGFFYYQKKKGISSKIPYMRWAQAWMFYAESYYLNFKNLKHAYEKPYSTIGNTSR
jgi:rhamnogalacturonyl hydrolase YesR